MSETKSDSAVKPQHKSQVVEYECPQRGKCYLSLATKQTLDGEEYKEAYAFWSTQSFQRLTRNWIPFIERMLKKNV